MDKKILILKNDRVGDLFHSLRNIELLAGYFKDYSIVLYLSKINIRFAKAIKIKNIKIKEINSNLKLIDKLKIFKHILLNKYEYVFILTPKNFYFALPLFIKNKKFIGICVDGHERKRPSEWLRRYLHSYEVNDRSTSLKKNAIYELERNLINKILFKYGIKSNNRKKKNIQFIKNNTILFHYKSAIFGEIQENYELFRNFFDQLVDRYDVSIKVSTDIENDKKNKKAIEYLNKGAGINFLGPINAERLLDEINKTELIISPHGAITCIAAYYDRNIIDIFDRTITKNAFYEFKPYTEGKYQFLVKSEDVNKTFLKIISKINNIYR